MNFFKKYISTTITQVLTFLISIGTAIIVARGLGAYGRGELSVIQNVIGMAVQFGHLGLPTAMIYFITKTEDKKRPEIFWTCNIFGSIISLILSFLIIVNLHFFPHLFGDVHYLIVIVGVIQIFPSLILSFFNSLWLALDRIRIMNYMTLFKGLTTLIYSFIALYILNFGVLDYIIGITIIIVLQIAIQFILLNNYYVDFNFKINFNIIKKLLSFGITIYMVTSIGWFLLKSDVLMVNYFLGVKETGYYTIAVRFAQLILIFSGQIGVLLFPRISANPNDNFITARLSSFVFPLMVIFALLFGFSSKYVIPLMFGNEYLPSVLPVVYLLPGIVFISVEAIYANYLSGIGKPGKLVPIWVFAGIFNIIFNYYYLPRIGIIAASISSTIGYFLVFITILIMIARITNISVIQYLIPSKKDILFFKSKLM